MDVADLVDAVACGEDVKHDKPDPALLQLALARLGARPEQSLVMIGDTPYDALAARRAGVAAIGMLSGGFSCKALVSGRLRAGDPRSRRFRLGFVGKRVCLLSVTAEACEQAIGALPWPRDAYR